MSITESSVFDLGHASAMFQKKGRLRGLDA
jgi:hypothetical protein